MHEISMADMNVGDKGIIICQKSPDNIKRRLQDIGIIEGAYIKCVLISPLKDPKAYLVRGAVVAIRADDALNIKVRLERE